ncbi:hypothetical protein [Dyella sp. 20L07]|uniref:hypothetical protein n=1 Tax=Dyella sp. 20L07 TaxID=3384240 RepID=UPI003D283D49
MYGTNLCRNNAREETTYGLNFIDVGKTGALTLPAQLDWAESNIRAAAGRQPEHNLVIVFVHGWFHSDAPADRDVGRARDTLSWFADQHRGWHVEGVFVGWQAYTQWPTPLQYLTFWSKERNADALGNPDGGALPQIVARMEASVDLSKDNKLLFVGHSFGGRALLEATRQTFLDRLNEAENAWQHLGEPGSLPQRPVRGVGSLVILIEPAVTADPFIALFNRSNELYLATVHDPVHHRPPIFAMNDRPLLLSVTSDADLAVKWALPLSTIVQTRPDESTQLIHWDGPPSAESSRTLTGTALGHVDLMVTHRVEIDGNASESCSNAKSIRYGGVDADLLTAPKEGLLPRGWWQCAVKDKSDHDPSTRAGSGIDDLVVPTSCADIHHESKTSPFNPYWNASTHKTFIQGHSDFMDRAVIYFFNQMLFSAPYTNDQPGTACHYEGAYTAAYGNYERD